MNKETPGFYQGMRSAADSAQQVRMIVWNEGGELVLETSIVKRLLVMSAHDDADVKLPGLGENEIFLSRSEEGFSALQHNIGERSRQSFEFRFAKVGAFCGFNWLFLETLSDLDQQHGLNQIAVEHSVRSCEFYQSLFAWLKSPMEMRQQLQCALEEYLGIVCEYAHGSRGFLAVPSGESVSLISCFGLDLSEAEKYWQQLPQDLYQQILRERATVVLPEILRDRASAQSTILLKGQRNVVAFPLIAEGQIVAILVLVFDNLFVQFSTQLQRHLEEACALAAVVVQRAQLRRAFDQWRQVEQSILGKHFPKNRLMLGSSTAMERVYDALIKLAPVNVPVLITGETGTGKELAARELHRLSPRHSQTFVAVNVAALPESLFESELFGHRKGAFTGALSDHMGLVEKSNGGTLFVDEIGELPMAMQAKLLRVLQEHCVQRVGETESRDVDFRLVCATHRDLISMVNEGKFREDLYYRIAGALLHLPPLRERGQDVVELAHFFKERFTHLHQLGQKQFTVDAIDILANSEWRGNIRELEHSVARAILMSDGAFIDLSGPANSKNNLADRQGAEGDFDPLALEALSSAKDRWLKTYIRLALDRCGGNRNRTAKALKIGERTLFRYIDQFKL